MIYLPVAGIIVAAGLALWLIRWSFATRDRRWARWDARERRDVYEDVCWHVLRQAAYTDAIGITVEREVERLHELIAEERPPLELVG